MTIRKIFTFHSTVGSALFLMTFVVSAAPISVLAQEADSEQTSQQQPDTRRGETEQIEEGSAPWWLSLLPLSQGNQNRNQSNRQNERDNNQNRNENSESDSSDDGDDNQPIVNPAAGTTQNPPQPSTEYRTIQLPVIPAPQSSPAITAPARPTLPNLRPATTTPNTAQVQPPPSPVEAEPDSTPHMQVLDSIRRTTLAMSTTMGQSPTEYDYSVTRLKPEVSRNLYLVAGLSGMLGMVLLGIRPRSMKGAPEPVEPLVQSFNF